MTNLPDEEPQRHAMHARIQLIRRHPRAWACLFVYGAILFEVALIEPISVATQALILGCLAIAFITCLGWLFYETSGSRRWGNGKLGEEATDEAVITWRRRRTDWQVVKGLPHLADREIGHVLVGPGGIYAIESIWTPDNCELDHGAILGLQSREPVAQAQESAHSIQQILLNCPDHLDVTVHPVVVLWGPGSLHLEDGWTEVDGTLIFEGGKDDEWLKHIEGMELDRRSVDRITDVLANKARRKTDQPDSRSGDPVQALGA